MAVGVTVGTCALLIFLSLLPVGDPEPDASAAVPARSLFLLLIRLLSFRR